MKKALEGRLGARGSLRLFLTAFFPEGDRGADCDGSRFPPREDEALWWTDPVTDDPREGGVLDRAAFLDVV
jgi:hypothetical protein